MDLCLDRCSCAVLNLRVRFSSHRRLSLAGGRCMVAHQRHRKKCVRMVKFFKVRVFIFIFFQNIICYFEFFYEKIYKIKNIGIQKDLKKKNYSWPSNAIDHNALPRLRNIMVSPHAHVFEFVNTSRRFALSLFQLKITVWSTMSKRNLEIKNL